MKLCTACTAVGMTKISYKEVSKMVPWGFLILAFLWGMVAGVYLLTVLLKEGARVVNAIERATKTSTPFRS